MKIIFLILIFFSDRILGREILKYLYPAIEKYFRLSVALFFFLSILNSVLYNPFILFIFYTFNFSDQFVILIISPNRSLLQYIDEELLLRYWQVTLFPCTLHLAFLSPNAVHNSCKLHHLNV